jgi:hypothetical protein
MTLINENILHRTKGVGTVANAIDHGTDYWSTPHALAQLGSIDPARHPDDIASLFILRNQLLSMRQNDGAFATLPITLGGHRHCDRLA